MSTNAFNLAISRASSGLTWQYPCLIWIADYVRDETGKDWAKRWRGMEWSEASARANLGRLAVRGHGDTAVERVMDKFATDAEWEEVDGPRQGAAMIGVYDGPDEVGIPAIFDGERRWVYSNDGKGITSTANPPKRMWVID